MNHSNTISADIYLLGPLRAGPRHTGCLTHPIVVQLETDRTLGAQLPACFILPKTNALVYTDFLCEQPAQNLDIPLAKLLVVDEAIECIAQNHVDK